LSAIEAAFSVALSLKDLRLLVRDSPSASDDDGGNRSEFVSGSLGADVGAGPLEAVVVESWDESDRIDGESNVGVEGTGDARSFVAGRLMLDRCGLGTAEGTADGLAEGIGLA
jgi:hypothetical protein